MCVHVVFTCTSSSSLPPLLHVPCVWCYGLSIDASGFLHEELKRTKRKLEKALREGDTRVAARLAKRMSELLRELAKYKRWGSKELLNLAKEYDDLYQKLMRGEIIVERQAPSITVAGAAVEGEGERTAKPVGFKVKGEVSKLDEEFDAEALKLIAKADVTWDDIAGLEEVKRTLMEALFYSLAKPSIPVKIEPPRRFLLYGPPGTGKTMLAMAASNMLKATFFNVSVDKVLSRYVGDSPRMISAIFRQAIKHAPSIIFFDEIEVLVARRDSDRQAATGVVQTFLTELDGFKTKKFEKPVIVIAATNKPWMLDEAILSRFEKRIYIPLPDHEARKQMFKIHLENKGFKITGITYDELARLTEGYSGRDIRNICQTAIMMMLRRANPGIIEKLMKIKDLSELEKETYRIEPITRQELLKALQQVKPATTKEDIKRYEEWTKQYGAV